MILLQVKNLKCSKYSSNKLWWSYSGVQNVLQHFRLPLANVHVRGAFTNKLQSVNIFLDIYF
jgi:hypothetical protein